MALQQDDTAQQPAPAFQWGANGARLTPEQIAAQRKVADAMMEKGSDTSPFPTGTRGAGIWTQGLARVAKGISAGMDYREADAASKANADDNKAMIAALLGGGGTAAPTASISSAPVVGSAVPGATTAASAAPAPSAVTPSPAVAAAAAVPTTDSNGVRFYPDANAATPFEPSGADRDATIRTVYGEAGNEPTKGQLAVAAVIRNRAMDGGYGGDTPTAVVHAPNQFEPWNGGPALTRMQALSPTDPKYAAIGKVVDAANGTAGRAADDPTEGKVMFYSPAAQAALGRPAPSWAKGDGQVIGGHTFYDDPDDAPQGKPIQVAAAPATAPGVQVASNDPGALPIAAAPVQGALPTAPAPVAPGVAKVSSALNPAVLGALTSPYASEGTKKIATLLATQQMTAAGKEHFTQETDKDGNVWNVNSNGQKTVALAAPGRFSQQTDADGNVWSVNNTTGQRTVAKAAEKDPASVQEYEYYKKNAPPGAVPMDYGTWADHKARAAATNVTTNVDTNSSQTYDKQLSEGLGKSHAALANGVEDAQSRARDIAAMQGAIDSIQKAGGTTGGMLPAQRLELQKSINAGASALGMDKPFSEDDISDKEFLTKFNRSMAGAQAKNAVGNRVTNFEMSNFLKANPGLDMSVTGNQRLLGIQSQIEQRNIAVGNAIRDATAQAISSGKKIDPVTVQGIITDYDKAHHISDPTTGQDLTQSYSLPEFQQPGQGTNASLAATHETNLGKMQRTNTGVTWSVQ